ncbi:MAG: hypothetical protein AAGD25_13050 [Cyanobacteria bacterium P01_F01_bin.150]
MSDRLFHCNFFVSSAIAYPQIKRGRSPFPIHLLFLGLFYKAEDALENQLHQSIDLSGVKESHWALHS